MLKNDDSDIKRYRPIPFFLITLPKFWNYYIAIDQLGFMEKWFTITNLANFS